MKLLRVLFVLALVGAAIAAVQKMMEDQNRNQDFWKPVDPLQPYSEQA